MERPTKHPSDASARQADQPEPPGAEVIAAMLGDAAAAWERRGYRVSYRDQHLVQLVGQSWPNPAVVLALVALSLATLAALILGGLAWRPWHVVSLSVTPEGRAVSHHQRSTRPPAL